MLENFFSDLSFNLTPIPLQRERGIPFNYFATEGTEDTEGFGKV
jgi:hypothetical protein